jgi:glycosyltransferase involved in cell wall biosynthesis
MEAATTPATDGYAATTAATNGEVSAAAVNGGLRRLGKQHPHILVLADRDWTHPQGGGSGRNLEEQVRRWVQWGNRVTVISAGYPGARPVVQEDDLTLHHVGGRSSVFPVAIWQQWRGLVPDADVVLEVINGVTFLSPIWLRVPRVALVHHVHCENYRRENGLLGRPQHILFETAPLRTLYRRTPFIAVSHATARELVAHGVPREQITVNYNGVTVTPGEPAPRATDPTIIYVGRLKRCKRVEMLIDAVTRLPGTRLDIVGEGEHRRALERVAAESGLDGRIRFHGFVDEQTKRRLLERAWLNVTASAAEGWSLVALEAAAYQTPTVAIGVGGLHEAIEHGRTGLLAKNLDELVAHCRRLLEHPAERKRFGSHALRWSRELDWDRTASRTLEIMERERLRAARRGSPPFARRAARAPVS